MNVLQCHVFIFFPYLEKTRTCEHSGSPVISFDSILKIWSPECYQWWANQEESGENLQNGKQRHVFLSFSKFEIGDNYGDSSVFNL